MGFWSDLSDRIQEIGQNEIDQRINNRYGGDHIQAQNEAVSDMGAILRQFNSTLPHSTSEYMKVQSQILGIASTFRDYAQSIGSARAMRGAAEVLALAKQIIRDLETQRTQTAQNPGMFQGLSNLPSWVLPAGIAAFFLMRKR